MKQRVVFVALLVLASVTVVCVGEEEDDQMNGEDLDAGDAKMEWKILRSNEVSDIVEFKERCQQTAGRKAVADMEQMSKDFVPCLTKIINIEKLRREINVSIPRGELDTVFKKYCRKRDQIMVCVEDMFSKLEVCLDETQQRDLNISRRAIDAGIDFVCHKEGDRIALFMGEEGEECVKEHGDDIKKCVEEKVPELKQGASNTADFNISVFTFSPENCKKVNAMHTCVVKFTERCDDPTPSNILDSLITQVLKVTPCWQTTTVTTPAVASASHGGLLLTILAAALTAANILL